MKRIFDRKNINLFLLLYTIITIGVSIYNLLLNNNYDYLGYWHEIYRAIFLMFIILLFDIIRNFSFKKSLWSLLEELLPLLLCLLLFGLAMYLKGDLSLDKILNYILYALGILIGLALLFALYQSLKTYLINMFKGKKKYFSFMSLLLIVLLVIPIIVYYYVNKDNNTLKYLVSFNWYIVGIVLILIVCLALLLSTRLKDEISGLNIVFILLYYFAWVFIILNRIDIYTIQIMQALGFANLLIYELTNNFKHCIPFTLISYLLMFIGCSYFFK